MKLFARTVGRHHKRPGIDIPVNSLQLTSEPILESAVMTDMTVHRILDDVNVSILEEHLGNASGVAGYTNGRYANWPAIVAKYGRSNLFLLSIDVQAVPSVGAQCLDIERFDAQLSQAPGWFKATQAAGKIARDLRWFPKFYTSAGNVEALIKVMEDAGIKRDEYLVWSAHYTDKAHICGPKVCGYPQADATQWTSSFEGASLDATQAYGYFFAGPPAVTPPKPVEPKVVVPRVLGFRSAAAVAELSKFGLKAGSEASVAGVVNSQTPGPGIEVEHGSTVNLGVKKDAPVDTPKPPVAPVEPVPVPEPTPVPPVAPAGSEPPTDPIVIVPVPEPEPAGPVASKPEVLVYVMEILTAEFASKIGLPAGTIVYIPHTVQGA